MPSVTIRPEFPNILIVSGIDVYREETLKGLTETTLFNEQDQPVNKDTHEFWILNPIPWLPDRGSNYSRFSPEPGRRGGVIKMGMMPDELDEPSITGYLRVLLQEVGHYWLCPSDLQLRLNNIPTRMATTVELTQAVNDDAPLPHVPLLARDESHWSAYWRADGSPMDGLCYYKAGVEDGYELWRTFSMCAQPISLDASVPDVGLQGYSDLDLYIMGLKSKSEAYRGEAGVFWMQPRLARFAESRSGIVVVFSATDQLMFGFDQHDRFLSLRTSSGQSLGGDIWPDYHPLQHDFNGLMFRVIRKRNEYFFQARASNPAPGCFGTILQAVGFSSTLPSVWDDVDNPSRFSFSAGYTGWKTIASVQRNTPPLAVGAFVHKWRGPHLNDTAFFRFEMKEGAERWGMRTDNVPPQMTAGDYGSLQKGRLNREETKGAIFRVKSRRLHVLAPFGGVVDGRVNPYSDKRFRHPPTPGDDKDPEPGDSLKVLTLAPQGDFAFATHAKLHRTIVTPWAGGYAIGKEMVGKVSNALAANTMLSPGPISRQSKPPNNRYRMAFIAVAPNANDIPLEALQRLDTLRRYWEVAFAAATDGKLTVDTSI